MSKTDFVAKNNKTYVIEIDDDGEEITVWHQDEMRGSISLSLREEGNDYDLRTYFHITHLALDGCAGLGIGRRCLELHIAEFGEPLTAGSANGQAMDDGSHLTGDGPGFISRMRELGIVDSPPGDTWDRYDADE